MKVVRVDRAVWLHASAEDVVRMYEACSEAWRLRRTPAGPSTCVRSDVLDLVAFVLSTELRGSDVGRLRTDLEAAANVEDVAAVIDRHGLR